jgi:hypothetical protein
MHMLWLSDPVSNEVVGPLVLAPAKGQAPSRKSR